VANYLQQKDIAAGYFHAGLQPESKKSTQKRFIEGDLRVIVATNAFGMGIDKPDVRLVIHADIPGSLENYLQEAGRAGRDRAAARCVLLYTAEDVERQFSLSARSRLTQREISAVLKSLRQLNRKKHLGGEIIATAGEILAEEEDGQFTRDSATDDTRVRTAISWLEESQLLTREENRVQIFPSSLRVRSLDEARAKLARLDLTERYRQQLLTLVAALIAADADEGISTDELMGSSGLGPEAVRQALHDLEKAGIASNDTALTAFVHVACERSSAHRFSQAQALENALIDILRQAAPGAGERAGQHAAPAPGYTGAERCRPHARAARGGAPVAGRAGQRRPHRVRWHRQPELARHRRRNPARQVAARLAGAGPHRAVAPERGWAAAGASDRPAAHGCAWRGLAGGHHPGRAAGSDHQRCRLARRSASPRKAARPRLAVAARARGDPAQQRLWRCFARR
jgi:hypothetical protein